MIVVGVGIGIGLKFGALLKALLAAGAVVAVVSVLTWERIRLWFRSREHLVAADRDAVGFSLVRKLKSNQYETVFGIFNQRTGAVVEAEAIESESLDDTLRAHHEREPLVIYR